MEETQTSGEFTDLFFRKLPNTEQKLLEKRRNKKGFSQAVLARALLFYGLRIEYGFEKFPVMERSLWGKPYFPEYPDICFNYSHSDAGIFVGLHRSNLGVDIQGQKPFRQGLVERIASDGEKLWLQAQPQNQQELQFARLWCLKEAYVKYTGTGIRSSLKSPDFSSILDTGRGMVDNSFCQVFTGENYACAVCGTEKMEKPRRVEIKDVKVFF